MYKEDCTMAVYQLLYGYFLTLADSVGIEHM